MTIEYEVVKSVWRITARRGGDTFKTEFVENRWVDLDDTTARPDNDQDLVWGTPHGFVGSTIRRKS